MTMRRIFDQELDLLHQDIVAMGNSVHNALMLAFQGMESRNVDQLMQVTADDKKVNEMEKKIETRCLRLLMKQQPVVATDLRAVSATLKLTTDLERIGDQAQDIADIGLIFCGEGRFPLQVSPKMKEMAQVTLQMVSDAMTALAGFDLALAKEVQGRDDQVDQLFVEVKKELADKLKKDESTADDVLDVMMISKYLERIADHSVNVCEWVEFFQTGIHQTTKIL